MTLSPTEDLMLAIVTIHGGRIQQEELHHELENWIAQYGQPTKEKTLNWIAQHKMELDFGAAASME
jgi:hypothetical protein